MMGIKIVGALFNFKNPQLDRTNGCEFQSYIKAAGVGRSKKKRELDIIQEPTQGELGIIQEPTEGELASQSSAKKESG